MERALEDNAKANNDSYPPYNIEQLDGNRFRITLAVAGFALADLSVVVEGPQLIICGEQAQNGSEFLHQGIATRKFKRVFVLADCIETMGSQLDDGLLNVDLRRVSRDKPTQKVKIC
ncbi:MAG: Hsp20 family protein [Alphaproteobacteria bacterium]